MKYIIATISILLVSLISFSQEIKNIQVKQDGDNVVITYDLLGGNDDQTTFDIEVKCSNDGGKTFDIIARSISGDIKGEKAGSYKQIRWNVLADTKKLSGNNLLFKLEAVAKNEGFGTFDDSRDGHVYKWVKIGDQIWMAENLAWDVGADCWGYDDKLSNIKLYGRLYSLEAAVKSCPKGWHLPTDSEWNQLASFISTEKGPYRESGRFTDYSWLNVGRHLKASSGWKKEGNGTDDFGFDGLPGGCRVDSGSFYDIGAFGNWWSATNSDNGVTLARVLDYNTTKLSRLKYSRNFGLSVRCIKD